MKHFKFLRMKFQRQNEVTTGHPVCITSDLKESKLGMKFYTLEELTWKYEFKIYIASTKNRTHT